MVAGRWVAFIRQYIYIYLWNKLQKICLFHSRNSHKKQKGDDATEAKKEDEFLPETLLAVCICIIYLNIHMLLMEEPYLRL